MDLFARAAEAVRVEQHADKLVRVRPTIKGMLTPKTRPDVQQVFPNVEYVETSGTGQFAMMEQPADFNRLLPGFLKTLS